MRNILTGQISDKTFKAGEKFEEPDLLLRPAQYLYSVPEGSETAYWFMDSQTYDQFQLMDEALGEQAQYLVENLELRTLLYNGQVVGIELPQFVEMGLVQVAPGSRGDTASGGVTSAAITETGLKIQVPLYIKEDARIRVDTGTGQFKDRVK